MSNIGTEPAKLAFTVAEFLRAVGIGRTSFYELVKSGKIRVIKLGGRTLVPRDEAERLARGEVRS